MGELSKVFDSIRVCGLLMSMSVDEFSPVLPDIARYSVELTELYKAGQNGCIWSWQGSFIWLQSGADFQSSLN